MIVVLSSVSWATRHPSRVLSHAICIEDFKRLEKSVCMRNVYIFTRPHSPDVIAEMLMRRLHNSRKKPLRGKFDQRHQRLYVLKWLFLCALFSCNQWRAIFKLQPCFFCRAGSLIASTCLFTVTSCGRSCQQEAKKIKHAERLASPNLARHQKF